MIVKFKITKIINYWEEVEISEDELEDFKNADDAEICISDYINEDNCPRRVQYGKLEYEIIYSKNE